MKLEGLEKLKSEYDKRDREKIGCGKEIVFGTKRRERRICGGFRRYGSKKIVYCKECQNKQDAISGKRRRQR